MATICVCALLLAHVSGEAPPPGCGIEKVDFKGWSAYRLTNGILEVFVAPEIGGRVIQVRLGGSEYFYNNPSLLGQVRPPTPFGGPWNNYGGSKTWIAPQGWSSDREWPGPPDPVLDGGPFTAEVVSKGPESVALRLTSGECHRHGVQMVKLLSMSRGTTELRHKVTLRNISRRTIEWAVWEVSQVNVIRRASPDPQQPGSFRCEFEEEIHAYAPLNPDSHFPRGYNPMFGLVNNPCFQPDPDTGRMHVTYGRRDEDGNFTLRDAVGKIGIDSPDGWVAVVNSRTNRGFFTRFDYAPGRPYPDGASVEFWVGGFGRISDGARVMEFPEENHDGVCLESEVLGPMERIEPGGEASFSFQWTFAAAAPPVHDVREAGATLAPAWIDRPAGAPAKLRGRYAVFVAGSAEVRVFQRSGALAKAIDLGPVTPLSVFDPSVDLGGLPGGSRLEIRVIDTGGNDRGAIDETVLPDVESAP